MTTLVHCWEKAVRGEDKLLPQNEMIQRVVPSLLPQNQALVLGWLEVERQADHARRAARNNSKEQIFSSFHPVQALENNSALRTVWCRWDVVLKSVPVI